MAADDDEEIDALFASDSDDDDFDPTAPAKEKSEQPAAESEPDDDDDQPAPAPRKALETAATCVPSTAACQCAVSIPGYTCREVPKQ